ncbi:MAG: CopG family transcriptional regulator [Brachybacterium tyrofermentans]|uniref:CopG family transcriptional regulator n=1 Tax=Brachybacterium TaxID=43668 RepID=UPI000A1B438A|nr:CopG family transcriptional regulator [Brachybacterium tyrofermentans]SLM96286.1 Prevent host death protein, Phd antitoxin \
MAMTLHLTDADEKILAELAEKDGVSHQEAAVRAIREVAARHGHQQQVSELSATGRTRYADLLDRLGQ